MEDNVVMSRNLRRQPGVEALCQQALRMVRTRAPSDGSLWIKVDQFGDRYRSTLKFVALRLRFSVVAEASNPYRAVERVMLSALDKVKAWAYSRSSQDFSAVEEPGALQLLKTK